jgi:hypothetical protein
MKSIKSKKSCFQKIGTYFTVAAMLMFLMVAATQVNAQKNRRLGRQFTKLTTTTDAITTTSTDIIVDPNTTTANPSATLEQCRNGAQGSHVGCIADGGATGWVSGNAGQSNSSWIEGDSIVYRMKFDNLATGGTLHTVTIGYDIFQQSKHAIDYLTSFDRTEPSPTFNNPCNNVSGCDLSVFTQFSIPEDNVTVTNNLDPFGQPIVQVPGKFTLFGGTIQSVAYNTYGGGDERTITLTFTADVKNPVLAWGGHIARRRDWGVNNSAIQVSGSPYHMRLKDLDGSGGNQDRSLSIEAVIFPAEVRIIKSVQTFDGTGSSSTFFHFTTTNLTATSFDLRDFSGDNPPLDTFDDATITTFGNTITVTEGATAGWSLDSINCSIVANGGATVGTTSTSGSTASIVLDEGNLATCTFNNLQTHVTAATATVSGRVLNRYGQGIRGAYVRAYDANTGVTKTVMTNMFGFYSISGLDVSHFFIMDASAKGYTFTSGQQAFSLDSDMSGVNIIAN